MQIKFHQQERDPFTLKSSNDYYNLYNIIPNNAYCKEANKFGYYDMPIITTDGIVISHLEEVITAQNNGSNNLKVIVAEGIVESNLIRFITHRAFYYKKSLSARYKVIKFLKAYLKKDPHGIAWAAELEGDTDEKLSFITGISTSSIKMIVKIGDNDIDAFQRINDRESSIRDEYDKTKKKNKDDSTDIIKIETNSEMLAEIEPEPAVEDFEKQNNLTLIIFNLELKTLLMRGNKSELFELKEKKGNINTGITYKFFNKDNNNVVKIIIKNEKYTKNEN